MTKSQHEEKMVKHIPPRGWGARMFAVLWILTFLVAAVVIIDKKLSLINEGKIYEAEIKRHIREPAAIVIPYRHLLEINGETRRVLLQGKYPPSKQRVLWNGGDRAIVLDSNGKYSMVDAAGGYGSIIGFMFLLCNIGGGIFILIVFIKGRTVYVRNNSY